MVCFEYVECEFSKKGIKMDKVQLPKMIRNRYELYTNLWRLKICGESLESYSHMISDKFERIVKIDEEDRSELYANGRIIFQDKKCGLFFEIGVSGALEKLAADEDVKPLAVDERSAGMMRGNVSYAKGEENFLLFLNGNVHFEDNGVILTGYFNRNVPTGYFYRHEKKDGVFNIFNLDFGDIESSTRESYNMQGVREGIERFENYQTGYAFTCQYKDGKKDGKAEYYQVPVQDKKSLLEKLYSVGYLITSAHRQHNLNGISMAMIARDRAVNGK